MSHLVLDTSCSNKQFLQMYQIALERLNQHFREYNEYEPKEPGEKILCFTSRQLRNFPNLIKFYQQGPDFRLNSRHTAPDQFEELYHNVQLLKDLKITCTGEYIVELQYFHSLENLYIIGPSLFAVKGLRYASTNLKSLTIVNGFITLNELLSLCCMDESEPMSWPCLLSFKISNCSVMELDPCLKLLPNLQELDLSFNRLVTAGREFCSFDQLTHLNLSFNLLKEVPQFNGSVRWQLQYLYLSYNELSTLEGLHVLENLLELDVSHNMLLQHNVLQPLRYIGHLQQLDLRGNPLSFNAHHRQLSLCCISPQALKPEFQLDGRNLTKHDLELAQYTPNAVSFQTCRFPVGEDASINSMEPEAYDVSMSSAADASCRQADGDSYLKLRPQSLKKKRSTPKTVVGIEPSDPDGQVGEGVARACFFQSLNVKADQDSGDEYSIVPQSSDNSIRGTASHTSVSEGLLESDHDGDGGLDSTSDYPTLAGVAKDVDMNDAVSYCHSVVDSGSNSSVQELETMPNTVKLDVYQGVIPSLRVKRNFGDMFGETDACLTLTRNHLIETDIDNEKVLEKYDLGNITNVSMHEEKILDIKFSYVKMDRRTRRYIFDKNQSLEDVNKLFRELYSVSLRNYNSHNYDFTCLKCSRSFSSVAASNLSMDDHRIKEAICPCGSKQVVWNDGQASEKIILFDDGDCQEAVESGIETDGRKVSASIDDCARSLAATASLSWIHTVHSVPDVTTRVFGQSQDIHASEGKHLSESLPSDLYRGSVQPHTDQLRNTVSTSVVNSSQQLGTPSRKFSHLLAPHPDLYKLVNVTASITAAQTKNVTGICIDPSSTSKNMFEGGNEERTSQVTKSTEGTGDSPSYSRYRQDIVTSTPRRRPAPIPIGAATLARSCPCGETGAFCVDILRRRGTLDFESGEISPGSNAAMVDNPLQSVVLIPDTIGRAITSRSLKKFLEEELLEVEEEIVDIFQTGLLYETGTALESLFSVSISGRKKRLFGPSKGETKTSISSASPVPYKVEIDVLLVLSTTNIHVLEVTDQKKPMVPENLKCLASHSLGVIIAVDIGLTGRSLFIALGSLPEKNKKFSWEHLEKVFVLLFRDRVKCEHFYHCCIGLVQNKEWGFFNDSGTKASLSSKTSEIESTVEFTSPFSDLLEKSFSEDVLVHLDLNIPELCSSKVDSDRVLRNELFSYNPCWMPDDETGKGIPIAVVISCGGSLCIVFEDIGQVMHEFAAAVVRSKRNIFQVASLSDSFSSTTTPRHCLQIPQSAIQSRSGSRYTFKSLSKCSMLKSIVKYKDQPECIRLNFVESKDRDFNDSWFLRFEETRSVTVMQQLVECYWEVENGAILPVTWK